VVEELHPNLSAARISVSFPSSLIEVLRLLALGLSNHEIAQALVIAESTVKMHLKHLYGKLSVHNRVQAITHAQARQLLQ